MWGLIALGAALVLGRLAWEASHRTSLVRARVRAAARELHLETTDGSWVSGHIDGFRVEIGPFGPASHAELKVDSAPRPDARIPPDLVLRSVTVAERLQNEEDVQIGDEPFDNAVRIQGKASEVLAVLDAPTRQVVDEALAANLRVTEGCLRRTVNCESLVKDVHRALELARWLSLSSESIAVRLAQNARADPLPAVRLRNLETLLRSYPDAPQTRAALRERLGDAWPQMRLRAALAAKGRGYATLARLISDGDADEEIAFKAFDVLIAHLPEKRQWSVIDSALRQPSPWLRERTLGQVLKLGGPEAPTRLARLLADRELKLAVEAARAIERRGDSSCERALLKALSVDDLGLRVAAAKALGAVGTIAAVVPLRQAIAGTGVSLLAPDLSRAVHDAIRRIQSRLSGAEAGQLSLAQSGNAEGRVSLSANENTGRVTLARKRAAAGKTESGISRRKKAARDGAANARNLRPRGRYKQSTAGSRRGIRLRDR